MNHFISLEQAIQMTTLYRENKEKILAEQFQNRNILCQAETFDRAAFDSLLAQPNCEKLRIYYGMDQALLVHAIVVGVDAAGNDILPLSAPATSSSTTALEGDGTGTTGDEETGIIEVAQRCPPTCATDPSPLNP